jgi:hypothetical protein
VFALLVATALAADPARPTLTGEVRDGAGRPLAGATVFVRTAAPKRGVGVL